ncbi:glycosyl hydrolase family 5 protein-like protein/cellulase [Lophiotrema nucula]|uniref:Glycosyl hydrolase family 5 protein-like protein/cellulase n=1 Tax=Lophiotrema nucula TaxID=690887 RepID=A0A6A5YVR2_9PLEO|nr:glycosyl hydrolase family 5 protein-like protein/cellulase [Lophiotrema nucula]
MRLPTLLLSIAALTAAFPNTPFKTSKRNVVDSTGANFTYIGVNWPGAADVMIPEGLQYQSIASIVSKIKSLKMNVVRLTFAIEMIDDIKDNGGDVTIQKAFTKALGASKGETVWQQVVKNNPGFNTSTTRIQAFDAVAAELAKQEIYVHLDNHMSKGAWCCGGGDGNTWFGDTYFNADKWKRGLQYMADHGKQWPNLISIGLRNELRKPDKAGSSLAYNWQTWYTQVTSAADLVNAANPDIILFLSGLDYDTTLSPIPGAGDLGGGKKFQLSSFKYANKLALELHNYQNSATSCDSMKSGLYNNGFKALDASAANQMPVILTEFGFSQTDSSYNGVYASCLRKIIPEWDAGWTVWVLAGSYYIRSGTQDFEEAWGLLKHDWSGWRSSAAIAGLQAMIDASLK